MAASASAAASSSRRTRSSCPSTATDFRRAPEGLFGGLPGTTGHCRIERDGAVLQLPSKGKVPLRRGDVVELAVGGGGGYGPPASRAPDRVAADRADGYSAA